MFYCCLRIEDNKIENVVVLLGDNHSFIVPSECSFEDLKTVLENSSDTPIIFIRQSDRSQLEDRLNMNFSNADILLDEGQSFDDLCQTCDIPSPTFSDDPITNIEIIRDIHILKLNYIIESQAASVEAQKPEPIEVKAQETSIEPPPAALAPPSGNLTPPSAKEASKAPQNAQRADVDSKAFKELEKTVAAQTTLIKDLTSQIEELKNMKESSNTVTEKESSKDANTTKKTSNQGGGCLVFLLFVSICINCGIGAYIFYDNQQKSAEKNVLFHSNFIANDKGEVYQVLDKNNVQGWDEDRIYLFYQKMDLSRIKVLKIPIVNFKLTKE